MVRTAVAAADPEEPDRPMSAPRRVPEDALAEIPVPQSATPAAPPFTPPVDAALPPADIDRLPPAARHRLAAYIHSQLAVLEDLTPLP